VTACQERRIGDVFLLLKNRAGIYPARIARLTGLTTSRVTEYMSGSRIITNMDVIERIADGLHIPGHLLGLARRNWEPSTPAVQQVDTAAGIETWDILDTLTRSTASPEALLHLEAAVLQNAMLYPSTPPMQLIPSMKRQLAKVHEFIGHPQSIEARRRCIQLIGVLGGLLGLAFLDTGDTGQSSALIHLGQVAAKEADDDGLTAWLLTMQNSTHRADQAVEILSRAEHLAISAPPRRQAWVSANLARAHAAEGNRPEALAALDRAGRSLCYGGDAGGLDFFNTARLDGISGTTHFLLQEYDAAVSLLDTSLANRSRADVKGRALLVFDLAECRIGQGEVDEACRLGHVALDVVGGSTLQPTVIRAQSLQHSLQPWRKAPAVLELAGRVRESQAQIRD
jgi:tetratricopeptide (TPR) repeat protein